jgi:RNA polymerase sigma factor (sigma-70 family)
VQPALRNAVDKKETLFPNGQLGCDDPSSPALYHCQQCERRDEAAIITGYRAKWYSVQQGAGSVDEQLVELKNRYETPLCKFLSVLVGDEDVAMDCAQDTFVRAYDNLRKGKPVNAGWLYRVARNRAMDEFRRRKRVHPDPIVLEQLPSDSTPAPEQNVAMRQAFACLEPDDRAILYLAAVEGLSGRELAESLGISHNAARMRLCRARERFRLAYGAAG